MDVERIAVAAGVGLLVGIAGADVVAGEVVVPVGFVGVAPLVAAAAAAPLVTAGVACAAVAEAALLLAWYGADLTVARLLLVVVLGVLAVVSAFYRIRREAALSQSRHVAATAQQAILRTLPTSQGRVTLASRYLSATAEAQVGGDLYEVTTTPSGLRVILGDVRGKGVEAIQLATVVLARFRARSPFESDPVLLAVELDEAVVGHGGDEDFVTAVLLDVSEDGTTIVTNCGHPPPLLVHGPGSNGERYQLLTDLPTAPPLGLQTVAGQLPVPRQASWEPGGRLLLYTDGLVEARGTAGRHFPPECWASDLTHPDLDTCLDALVRHVKTHTGDCLDDDLALVLLQFGPEHVESPAG